MKRITFSKAEKQQIIGQIQEFFLNERDELLGDLAAEIVLDFIIKEIGPKFYNQGINDSHQFLMERVDDLLGITIKSR
ncbi:MAG: hypothetical protein K0S51_1042 [Bacillales bacterium]|jgi:uncharacterized protein (DUF2164 family)|nr:hypothetical protein [Bacillales bacterium]